MTGSKPHVKTQKSLPRIKVLRALRSAVAGIHRMQGYRWEEHRVGGYKIGVWRKRTLRGLLTRRTERKTFVLVPGFGDSSLSWFPFLKILEPIISTLFDEVALMDFPGFSGHLHEEKGFHSMDLFLRGGSEILSRLNAHTVLGHSLGGWLTTYHAGMAGKKPVRIILVSPSGAFDDNESKVEWGKKFRKVLKSRDFAHFRPFIFEKEPLWFPLVAKEFAKFIGQEDIRAFMRSVGEKHFVEDLLPTLKSDIWFIWGEKDRLVPIKTLVGWTNRLPAHIGANQCILLKDTGHTPQLESVGRLAAAAGKILLTRTP